MNLSQKSDLGLRAACACRPPASAVVGGAAPRAPHTARAVIGYTTPSVTYDRMRQIDASADSLDRDMKAFVSNAQTLAAWAQWLKGWKTYIAPFNLEDKGAYESAKLWAVLSSDDIARQVDSYRQQLDGWYLKYAKERLPNGQPVPDPSGLPPTKGEIEADRAAKNNSSSAPSVGLPWYFWLGLGVAGVGVLYLVYKQTVAPLALAYSLGKRDPAPTPAPIKDAGVGLPTLEDYVLGKEKKP
jgi:hypothetical protein